MHTVWQKISVDMQAKCRAVGSILDVGRRVQSVRAKFLTTSMYHALLFVKHVLAFAD